MLASDIDAERAYYEQLIRRVRVVRCPYCDTSVEVPLSVETEDANCSECGQNLADNPMDRLIEIQQ